MGKISGGKFNDGRVWYCKERSIRLNSFFMDSRLLVQKLVELMYWWAAILVTDQVGITSKAAVNWYHYFRDIGCMYCIDHPNPNWWSWSGCRNSPIKIHTPQISSRPLS